MEQIYHKVSEALDRAVSAYRAGRLAEAERLCHEIIAEQDDCFDAYYLLATVQSALGQKENALASFGRALTLNPNGAAARNDLGFLLQQLKRYDEALAQYDRAIGVRSDFALAHFRRGNVLQELRRFEEALASYDRTLALRPKFAVAYFNRGNVLQELKRFEEALVSYDRALELRPNLAVAHSNRANALQTLHRCEEALVSYERALNLRPDFAEALSNRANAFLELKRYEEALASYDRALALRPDFAEAYYNRGNALQELKRFEEAIASYDSALDLRPNFAEAHSNRGNALQPLKRYENALASYDRALTVQPHFTQALLNRGVSLQELRRFDEAFASYDRALALQPDYAEVHFNEAICRLLLGDFDRGWEKYEWGWEAKQRGPAKRSFTQPLWLGREEIAGKTILLHAEQGFGDTIQFCRYVPLVAERGARVILAVQEPLRELMASLADTTQVTSMFSLLPEFDMQCPLLSLPLAFRTQLETIPSKVPYLSASSQAVANWETRLGPKHRPRIGLAWSGRPTHTNDRNRSISFKSLLPLLDIDATFVSVQNHVRREDAIVLKERSDILHFDNEIKDFSDTAALIANLDLLISVDTSVAHLAGALAKPVWIMLPFTPDWRWLLDREDSPWYPTARLFRQDDTRAWDNVIAQVRAALGDFLETRHELHLATAE